MVFYKLVLAALAVIATASAMPYKQQPSSLADINVKLPVQRRAVSVMATEDENPIIAQAFDDDDEDDYHMELEYYDKHSDMDEYNEEFYDYHEPELKLDEDSDIHDLEHINYHDPSSDSHDDDDDCGDDDDHDDHHYDK
jgi:hypothetical protein